MGLTVPILIEGGGDVSGAEVAAPVAPLSTGP